MHSYLNYFTLFARMFVGNIKSKSYPSKLCSDMRTAKATYYTSALKVECSHAWKHYDIYEPKHIHFIITGRAFQL